MVLLSDREVIVLDLAGGTTHHQFFRQAQGVALSSHRVSHRHAILKPGDLTSNYLGHGVIPTPGPQYP